MIWTNSNDNEKIEVHDASILRSNEHPKFKIGDVINNGYGDFTVKGFTRSFAGLAYVLDNGHKLIGWLTEQVDVKCHLVENNSIKEILPKYEPKSEIQSYIDKHIKFIYIEKCEDKFHGILTDKDGITFEFSKDVIDIEKRFDNTHKTLCENADIRKNMLMNCFKRLFIINYELRRKSSIFLND